METGITRKMLHYATPLPNKNRIPNETVKYILQYDTRFSTFVHTYDAMIFR